MNSTIKFNILISLFLLPPILALLGFIVNGSEGANLIFMISNLLGVITLSFLFKNSKVKYLSFFYSFYFFFCFFLYPQIEGSKMYISATLYTTITLLFFSSEELDCLDSKNRIKLNKLIVRFALILIIGQLLTIDNPLSFIRINYNSVEENALDQKGFMISHAFGYYLAAFIMYFAHYRKLSWMIFLTALCFFFTRRTNVLLCLLGWFYYFYLQYGFKFLIVILLGSLSLAITYMGATSYLGDFAFSLDPSDSESAAFTSGRTRFWGSYLLYLQSGNMKFHEYLFGFGPASSRDFNSIYAGLRVWMHNDFFDIAYCLGFVGLILYVYTIVKSAKALGLVLFLFIFVAGNINGFMLYQTYPIIFIFAILNHFNKSNKDSLSL